MRRCMLSEHLSGPPRLRPRLPATLVLQCFYSAPLSTVRTVIRTRCSATLHWPLLVMNCINGSLWTAYGIAVTDYFIWIPNCIGAVLAVFMLVRLSIFLHELVSY